MYKLGHDYDYQYDWVLKKQGKPVPEDDLAGNPKAGNIAAVQGKESDQKPSNQTTNKFIEERKENRAALGAQVVNGFAGNGSKTPVAGVANATAVRQSSAKKR